MFFVTFLKEPKTKPKMKYWQWSSLLVSMWGVRILPASPPTVRMASWLEGTSNLMVLRANNKTAFSVFFYYLRIPLLDPSYTVVECGKYSCTNKRRTYSMLIIQIWSSSVLVQVLINRCYFVISTSRKQKRFQMLTCIFPPCLMILHGCMIEQREVDLSQETCVLVSALL